MYHHEDTLSTHSVTDDEELLKTGLLDGSSSIRVKKQRNAKTATFLRFYLILLHAVLLALVLFMVQRVNPFWGANHELIEGSTWSPIQKFIKYEVRDRDTHGYHRNKTFAGRPTPEKDRAWDHLIKPAYFNATAEELERAGESLSDIAQLLGGGYLASIGVYHELHCVRQLRFYLYKDRYYPNLTETDNKYLQIHLDHCIEALRETVMCNGNTAVISFFWDNPKSSKPAAQSSARSQCVQWDSIERWGYSRMTSTSPDFQKPYVGEEP
ncbi:hypothetical protein F5Y04DRAFT_288908 [Hypomontagnella monticulosa]|nr:hypothetical protein F5Y04DRAFT_288908 [Hypomontagnella monticulosa]